VSEIQYLGINENFPVADQDNDTQVFRDNFDTIKNSLRVAQTEVESLQDSTAKTTQDNNFEGNTLSNTILRNVFTGKFSGGSVSASPTTIDYKNGGYQIYTIAADLDVDFLNFPGDPLGEFDGDGAGKVTLELYNNGATTTVNFISTAGTIIKKDPNFPNTLQITSQTNPTFIEIWRHNAGSIFIRYLGVYS